MALPYISQEQAALFSAHQARRSIFFRLESDPPLHIWSGAGDILAPMVGVSVGDDTYFGTGQFQGLPELSELVNGLADRVEFTVSGLDARAMALVQPGAPEVRNVALHIGLAAFDSGWQLATSILPVAVLTADFVALRTDPPSEVTGRPTVTLSLSCHYGEPDRFRGKLIYWTPPHQGRVDADDEACDWVYLYQSNYQVTWPRA